MHLRIENLRHLGWRPFTVESCVNWCAHAQKVIPWLLADGGVVLVPVLGEAR
jgi:hypothetical protein